MIRSLINTLTQAVRAAWDFIRECVAPSMVKEMSKREYAFLRRVNTILAVSNACCLIFIAGAGMISSVLVLGLGLAVALSFLQYFLEGEVGEIAGLAR